MYIRSFYVAYSFIILNLIQIHDDIMNMNLLNFDPQFFLRYESMYISHKVLMNLHLDYIIIRSNQIITIESSTSNLSCDPWK